MKISFYFADQDREQPLLALHNVQIMQNQQECK